MGGAINTALFDDVTRVCPRGGGWVGGWVDPQSDFLRYIEYELNLEQLRKLRKRSAQTQKATFGDQSIVQHIHFVFQRATKRFHGDVPLWVQYLDFCEATKSTKQFSKVASRALQLHPRSEGLWIRAASKQWELNRDMKTARHLMQQALRLNKRSMCVHARARVHACVCCARVLRAVASVRVRTCVWCCVRFFHASRRLAPVSSLQLLMGEVQNYWVRRCCSLPHPRTHTPLCAHHVQTLVTKLASGISLRRLSVLVASPCAGSCSWSTSASSACTSDTLQSGERCVASSSQSQRCSDPVAKTLSWLLVDCYCLVPAVVAAVAAAAVGNLFPRPPARAYTHRYSDWTCSKHPPKVAAVAAAAAAAVPTTRRHRRLTRSPRPPRRPRPRAWTRR
jgi:hypothetical protein